MDDKSNRAEQLEELLRELREKRLAQTMELEQIKTDYLNHPSKPIQPASRMTRADVEAVVGQGAQAAPADERRAQTSGAATAAPRSTGQIDPMAARARFVPNSAAAQPAQQRPQPAAQPAKPAHQRPAAINITVQRPGQANPAGVRAQQAGVSAAARPAQPGQVVGNAQRAQSPAQGARPAAPQGQTRPAGSPGAQAANPAAMQRPVQTNANATGVRAQQAGVNAVARPAQPGQAAGNVQHAQNPAQGARPAAPQGQTRPAGSTGTQGASPAAMQRPVQTNANATGVRAQQAGVSAAARTAQPGQAVGNVQRAQSPAQSGQAVGNAQRAQNPVQGARPAAPQGQTRPAGSPGTQAANPAARTEKTAQIDPVAAPYGSASVTGKTAQLAREELAAAQGRKTGDTRQLPAAGSNPPRPSRRLNETMQFELPKERPSFTSFTNTAQLRAIRQAELEEQRRRQAESARPKKSKRSIFENLIGDKPDSNSIEFDPINKDMLAPTIERGVDAIPDAEKERLDALETVVPERNREYTENHALFTSQTAETFIPPEAWEEAEERRAASDPELMKTTILPRIKKEAKKSVLNVRENVDDSFREFFGDTVIIDRESLNDKARRQRKIKDYVVADKDGEAGGPVFEETGAQTNPDAVEYGSDEDAAPVLDQLKADGQRSLVRTAASGVCALLLLVLNIMAELNLVSGGLAAIPVFYGVNLALLALGSAICYKTVFAGFGRLVSFRANEDALISFSCIAGMLECLVRLFDSKLVEIGGATACVAAAALFFNQLGHHLDNRRILSGFRTVSENYEKYASDQLDDPGFARHITRGLELNNPSVLVKRKTGFTENFLPQSYSEPDVGRAVPVAASILLFVCIGCGVAGFVLGNGLFDAVRYMALAAAFTGPFVSSLARFLPVYCMQRSLSKVGAVVPGYSAADRVCGANCVVLEGRELFPKGNVLLHGIKTFERERIDKAILYAASVIVQSCDTMSPMFLNVIQNKTEMLYPIDGVEYESGLGYSFWIDKTRILLGTRELLREHEVETPSRDYESRYTKTNTRDALYLAVAGKLYAMFVISYAPNAEVEQALRSFEREGVCILVHTRDFNITPAKIARLYNIPETMVAVVREEDIAELTNRTGYTARAASALTHIGSLSSYVRGIIACYNLRSCAKLASAIELACMILGALSAAALCATGVIATFSVISVLFFQLLCCLLMTIVVTLHRY